MKIPVIAGRGFTAGDTAQAAPVAVVNEVLARRMRPDGRAVGARVVAEGPRRPGERAVEREIVGVIANTRSSGADTRARSELYVPYAQSPLPLLYVIVETDARNDAAVSADVRRTIRELQPGLVVEPIEPMLDVLNRRLGTTRLGASLLGAFAAMAVALAAVGLMTTIGWWVSQRTRELGIRMALGASPAQVFRLVFRQGMALGVAGIAAGWLMAAGATRYLAGWIYGVEPLDRATFTLAAACMFVVAACAIGVPARKAIGVDPAVALRTE
jgi:hypothetical protein